MANILVFTYLFPPKVGGGTLFVKKICDQLAMQGHAVEVLAPWWPQCEKSDTEQPYKVHRYLSRRPTSFGAISKTIRLCLARNFDLVFLGHLISTHALGVVILQKLFRTRYAVLVHGNDLRYSMANRVTRFVGLMVLRNASLLLANSHFTGNMLVELGAAPNRVRILHPGVDANRFNPGTDGQAVQAMRDRFGLEGHRVLLTVSRLVSNKNHSTVLRALPIVAERIPNVRYLIVGDGPWRERLEGRAQRLGLLKRVVFAGTVSDDLLPAVYHAADVYVMPSKFASDEFEGFGIAYIEAGACGKPVIGGLSGGTSDAVIDGVTGLLVNPEREEEIAEAAIRLLTDKAYARTLGENGRRRVENEFQWNIVGEGLNAILRDLVQDG